MFRRIVVFAAMGLACIMAIQAAGSKDNLSFSANNPAGFTDSVDINNLPPGKYNFYIEATDKAGNVGRAGPDNIFIDPVSDLPVTTVINPRINMHVQGNLNIVGICADDDAVHHVEFVITRGADGRGEEVFRAQANGAEFWSYFLDTTDTARWPDGVYTITAWGIDINGLSGISEYFKPRQRKMHQVVWHLDRKKPDARIYSHEVGSLVAGRIRLQGTVFDGNGVKSLRYAIGEGSRYQNIPIRYDRRNNIYTWDLNLDTRTLEDGPAVVWLQSRDGQGTLGVAAHLLFINNTSPDVQIVYPEPDAAVSGVFTISGYASHPVGLKSLTWKLGKESGEFPLVIGNPWWVKEFDIRNERGSSIDLEIRAEDLSGNVTVVKRRLKVDQFAGLPKVVLTEPVVGAVVHGDTLIVRGYTTDNDAVSSILYSINAQEAVEIPAHGHFQIAIPSPPPGVNNILEVWARDYTGIEGPKAQVRGIIAPGPAPAPRITSVTTGSGKTLDSKDFYSGIEINSESGSSLDLWINSGSGLQTISYQLGGKAPVVIQVRGSRGGDYNQSIPIPPDIDFGQVKVEIKVRDIYDRETALEEYIYVTNLTAPRILDGHVSVNRLSSGYLALTGVGDRTSWPSQIEVARGDRRPIPLTATIDPSIQVSKAVVTIAGRAPINASVRNGAIQANLPADLPADLIQLTLTLTQKSGEINEVSGEFWLLRPRVESQQINIAEGFTWVRPDTSIGNGRILISGEPLIGLYNGRPLQQASISGPGADSMSVRVDENGRVRLQAMRGGSFGPMILTLIDRDNKQYVTRDYSFLVDNSGPEVSIVTIANVNTDEEAPFTGAPTLTAPPLWTQDKFMVKLKASDANGIQSVDVSMDLGHSWRPLFNADELSRFNPETVYERTLDITSFEDGLVSIYIRAVNDAGRDTVLSFAVQKDTQAPKPQLIVPISQARVNGTIRLGIAIQEAGSIKTISYRKPAAEGDSAPAIVREVYPGTAGVGEHPPRFLDLMLDATEMPLDGRMAFVFEDKAGNRSELSAWPFVIDNEMDIPVVHIILPLDEEVITADFEVSGVMFDDDAIKQIYWHIDENPDNVLEADNAFTINVALSTLTDNEHTITVVAEDIYGIRSEPVTRMFKVSLTEPMGDVLLPAFEEIVRGTVTISGTAFDENGIDKVQVSLDSGNTFNDTYITTEPVDANGKLITTSEWTYQYNSTIFPDGSNVVFIRVYDNYGITAIYSSLVNLDNTPPEVTLDSPGDGIITTGPVYITGRAIDDNIAEITIEVRSLEGVGIPEALRARKIEPSIILMESLNLAGMPDGLYNIEIWAIDKADNVTRVSRNVQLARESRRNFVEILYPLDGEHVQGTINVYGNVGGIDQATTVTLSINGYDRLTTDVSDAGYYRFSLDRELLTQGWNQLMVHSNFGGAEAVLSPVRNYYYLATGPWVTIDSLDMGDFAYDRPWFTGRAGYVLSEDDYAILANRSADRELRDNVQGMVLDYVDISFDNGNTFVRASRSRERGLDWQYRLETGDMKEGIHYILVRANMRNGETAITRTLLQVDKTPPHIRLIAPQAGGRYNQHLDYAAMAADNVELSGVTYHLRKGDKAAYEVPGFLQGLYFEITIPPFIRQITNDAPALFGGGVSYMDFGLGLSFFDDNVKLQIQYGFMTQDLFDELGGIGPVRYGGNMLGLKLLANIYTLPFITFAGPDWEWLSASFAIGANFTLFNTDNAVNPKYANTDPPTRYTQSGSPTWMSALVAQIEFPKVTIPKRSFLRTFSFFTEGQLWFVPTDVDAKSHGLETIIPHMILGLRMYIF